MNGQVVENHNPEFAVLHLLVFDKPNDYCMGRWSVHSIRARLRSKYSDSVGEFTISKIRSMVKRLQDRELIDVDYVPLTVNLLFYCFDRKHNSLMKEIYDYCSDSHPDLDAHTFSIDRLRKDIGRLR